jgi:hypothetical protein
LEQILPESFRDGMVLKGMLAARKSALKKLNNAKKD